MQVRGRNRKRGGWIAWMVVCLWAAQTQADEDSVPLPKELKGQWQVVSVDGVAPADKQPRTLVINSEKVSGKAGCNNYFGGYQLNGDQIIFEQIATTEKYCAEAIMDEEQRYLQYLDRIEAWKVEKGQLLLLDGNDQEVIRLSRP